jgi:hypothetical protein
VTDETDYFRLVDDPVAIAQKLEIEMPKYNHFYGLLFIGSSGSRQHEDASAGSLLVRGK